MSRYGRSRWNRISSSLRTVHGYTLRGRNGRINYVGVTNNPGRRAIEHRQDGKRGCMEVETLPMSPEAARRWEASRLATYRGYHGGKNPPQNKTWSGGWNG